MSTTLPPTPFFLLLEVGIGGLTEPQILKGVAGKDRVTCFKELQFSRK